MMHKDERLKEDLPTARTRSLPSSRASWALNWHLLLEDGKSDPSKLFEVLNTQTFNDRELFQAVIRRDWEAAHRFIKRLKIKLTSIHAISSTKKAAELEILLQKFQAEDEEFSKTKFYKYREKLLPREVELVKKFVGLFNDLRDVIIEIEDFTDETFNAGNCNLYVEELEGAFFSDEDLNEPKKEPICYTCNIF